MSNKEAGRWVIPDDYIEGQTEWRIVMMCVPDCRGWRSVVSGAIYNLTRGRYWDESTGIILVAQDIARRIFGSLRMDCYGDFTRMADALEDIREIMGPLDPEHNMLTFMQELQALGGSVAAGDTIMVSLQKMIDRMPTDMTLGELVAQLETANDPNFKDFLELLTYLQQLFPNLPNLPFAGLFQLIGLLFNARHKHTHSTAMVLQAQHLWGIQNALTAYQGDTENEQADAVSELWETLQNTPWLTTVIGALVDPSPAGEVAFSAKVVAAATQVWARVTTWWTSFRDSYINQIEEPVPVSTVTGQLAEIAARLQNLDLGTSEGGLGDVSGIINALLEINQSVEEDMSITQQNTQTVNCSGGGAAGFQCGCPVGTGFVPDENPTGSAADTPVYTLPGTGYYPPGFSSVSEYTDYKCKAANSLFLNLTEGIYQVSEIENTDLLGVNATNTIANVMNYLRGLEGGMFGWIANKAVTLQEAVIGWIGDPLGLFVYAGEPTEGINALRDIRLDMLSDRQTVVCAMYNAFSESEARTELLAIIDGYFSGHSYSQTVEDWVTDIITALLTNAVLSPLFVEDSSFAAYDDDTAIDCLLCSDYIYPTGTCTASAGAGYAPENGQGDNDGVETNPMPEDSYWQIVFDTPIAIVADMTLEVWNRLVGGTYQSFTVRAMVGGVAYDIYTDHDQSNGEWRGANLNAYIGQSLTGAQLYGANEIAQSPTFAVDGCRVGGTT